MFIAVAFLLTGLFLLTVASDRLVVSAARVSKAWGISVVLIGALVVGLGTSAPELLVSWLAAARGELDLAMGNVIGSNVSNVTLVLGTAAMVGPVVASTVILRREGLLMATSVIALAVVVVDGEVSRVEGGLLVFGMMVAAYLLIRWSLSDPSAAEDPQGDVSEMMKGAAGTVGRDLVKLVIFLGITLLGADLLLRGAVRIADELGLESAFVGLVLVAVGTSLPELATSLAAARHGESGLILGNILGSNLFNSLIVAGTAGVVGPSLISGTFRLAAVIMVGTALIAGLFSFTGRRVVRYEGAFLLAAFVVFVVISA